MTEWYEQKRSAEQQAKERQAQENAAAQAWQQRLQSYENGRQKIRAVDFHEAEAAVQTSLDVTQQGIIVHGADNPAMLVYALGKNKATLEKLKGLKDPVQFAFAVAKLESQMRVTNSKPSTQPESRVASSSRSITSSDATLERLRAEAAKTGNFSRVMQYKRNKRS